ncbi:MATE family efflux transporter [Aestuariirhabdus litorea]|uniref:Multidrug-efflux transporter n=1 Tax=Aestuariirhabdus litorea TaxID=2528527 RepID=A0A3P3VRE3_9GAMM|nr:MATE family efflux transporter [Aestuariirhabdus litorea]RRJ84877.1 MATE family efflux transporter [Aestuariirhabdus litorea]RWW98103.1 MATE family efflux transporter [Endozoicomonadaceae bacterium GTF-13]
MQPERIRRVSSLALPIMGGMLSQSLLNLVDAAMVGSLGEVALAGVGVGAYINFLAVSMIMGLSSGVQAIVARRVGQGRSDLCAQPLNVGLLCALLIALPISLLFYAFSPWLVALISSEPAVTEVGVAYFDARIMALSAVAMNFSFRGYWNGTHRSSTYLKVILVMHAANILISYALIFGAFGLPRLDAAGAGWGTSIAMVLGSLLYFSITTRKAREHGFLRTLPDRTTLRSVLRLAIPNSLQQMLFALGITLLFWIIARIGTEELAVAHVLINLALFLILPGVGLGMAATTLVSKSLGANEPDEAYRWGWDVVRLAVVVLLVLGIPFWLFPDAVLSLFLHNEAARAIGHLPLQLTAAGMVLDATAIVLTQALLGAGANRTVMRISASVQWLLFLPLAWLLGPVLGYGLSAIWALQLGQRALSSLLFASIWRQRQWISIRI